MRRPRLRRHDARRVLAGIRSDLRAVGLPVDDLTDAELHDLIERVSTAAARERLDLDVVLLRAAARAAADGSRTAAALAAAASRRRSVRPLG